MYSSWVLVTVLWNQKWRGAISFTAHKMRTAKRGLISNIQLVKKNTWKCQGKECLWAISDQDLDLIDPGLSSSDTRPGASPTPSHAEALAEKKPCLGKHGIFVSSHECSSPWRQWPSHLPGYTDSNLHIYKHILMNTFLPVKLVTFGFLLIASNFYSHRIPAWLDFIPQPFPNYVKHE